MKRIFKKLTALAFLIGILGTADVSALTISTSFTSAVAGASIAVRANDSYTFSVSGTFVGTVILERSQNGGQSWKIIKTSTAGVSSTTVTADLENAGLAQYRFRCSAYTSGTIVTSLANATKVYFQRFDDSGNLLFQIDDSGVTSNGASVLGAGTATEHSLNSLLATNGTQAGTLSNLPAAATAGNAFGFIQIKINGTDSYIPFWH